MILLHRLDLPIGGASLRPLCAQLWSAAHGGSDAGGGGGLHLPSVQMQSRPLGSIGLLDQRQSLCTLISSHGCGGGGGGGSSQCDVVEFHSQRGFPCLSTALAQAVLFSSFGHGVGGGAGGAAP